jgi:hypothetical protein
MEMTEILYFVAGVVVGLDVCVLFIEYRLKRGKRVKFLQPYLKDNEPKG